MGADMIVSVVATKKGADPSWEAGQKFLADLVIDEVLAATLVDEANLDEDDERFFEEDQTPKPEGIRKWLQEQLSEFHSCLNSREVATIGVRDLWLYITGGMSWGDDTDAGYLFSKMWAVPGLLGAMDFVVDFHEEDRTVTPEEEAAAVQSIVKAAP